MPMYATALALSNGKETLAIADVDAIGFDEVWTARILDAISSVSGLAKDHIRFSCTHTHSGANTFRLGNVSEGLDMVTSYLESLPLRIAGAVYQALRAMRPVRCAAGAGRVEISVNRRFRTPGGPMAVGRNWRGPVDPLVRVVRLDALDETPVATLVHYACHPTTMAWQNKLFTPDYPGMCRHVMEREVGGYCLFLQGAAGNLTPRRGFTGDTRVYRWLGQRLGLAAAATALAIETLPKMECYRGILQSGAAIALYEDEPVEPPAPSLGMITRTIELPLKPFDDPEKLASEALARRQEMERARSQGSEEDIRAATARYTQASWRADAARRYSGKQTIPWQLQAIRIGDIALLSMQGEPFIEIALRIVEASPFTHTLVSGYSNGGFGYIPTREACLEGGYEVEQGSPFAGGVEEVVVDQGLRLLKDLKEMR